MDRTGGGKKRTREETSDSPSFDRVAYPRLIEDMDQTGWIPIYNLCLFLLFSIPFRKYK